MDFFTHLVFGMITALLTLRQFDEEFVLLAIIMAVLPDADLALIPFHKVTKKYYFSHRGGSHSYFIGLILSLVVALIFTLTYGGAFYVYWIIGSLYYSLHVTLDFLTTSRIPAFYPLSKKEYRFNVDRAVNPLMMASSFIIFISSLYFDFQEYQFAFRNNFRLMVTYLYYGVLFYRLSQKIIIQSRFSPNQFYIPGILPIVYYTYNTRDQNGLSIYQLIKKVQLIPLKTLVYRTEIKNKTQEMDLMNKTLIISKNYRFFSKWDGIIPIVRENNGVISIIFFLAESYTHGSAYFLKINYEKNSGNLLEEKDGFNFIKRL
ncbi:MAG: metal-dependent hydrolase [Promethearchaeota archaeon]